MKFALLSTLTTLFSVVNSNLQLDVIIRQLPARTQPLLFCVIQTAKRNDPLQNLYQLNANRGHQQFVVSSNPNFNLFDRCSHYLVSFDEQNLASTEELFLSLFLSRGWNNRGYFLFLIDSSRKSLNLYGKFVKKFAVTSSALIIWEPTLRYFGLNYFVRDVEELSSVADVVQHLRNDFLRNVNGQKFRVGFYMNVPSAIHLPGSKLGGSAVMLADTFVKYINASIWWSFGLEEIHIYKFAQFFVESNLDLVPNMGLNSSLVETIPGHLTESIVLIIPETLQGPFFEHLLRPFSTSSWFVILVTLCTVWILNRKLNQYFPRNMLMMLFFGSATPEHRLKRTERLVLVSLDIMMFVLSESYLAIMLSFILTHRYEAHLQTLDDFEKSTIPLCMYQGDDPIHLKMLSQMTSIDLTKHATASFSSAEWYNVEWCSRLMRYDAADAFLRSKLNNNDKKSNRKFYMLPQHVIYSMRTHSMPRQRPFAKLFDLIQRWTIEAGLWIHWDNFVKDLYTNYYLEDFEFFSFNDLLSLVYILIYGHLTSAIVLLAEIVIYNYGEVVIYWRNYNNKNVAKLNKAK